MSDAEYLRETAALMRERAEAATKGPYLVDSIESGEFAFFLPDGRDPGEERLGCGGSQIAGWMTDFNAAHMAAWHPAVALAVAALLDAIAWTWKLDPDLQNRVGGAELLALARKYRGDPA